MATFEDGITRNRKVEVVIQSSQVPGDLTDYEWTVTEANLPSELFDSDGANPAQNGGGDIRFSSDSDGNNQLAIDVVTLITDADPANGEAEINVLVPSVSGSVDTSIWVWYNTDTTSSQPSPSSTFGSDNAYRTATEAVWTMNEDPTATAPQFIDRTANSHDGTSEGAMTAGDSVAGKIGNALAFDGSNDRVNAGTLGTFGSKMDDEATILFWIKTSDSNSSLGRIMGAANDSDAFAYVDMGRDNPGDIEWFLRGGSTTGADRRFNTSTGGHNDGAWHRVMIVSSDTQANLRIHVDGVSQSLQVPEFETPVSVDFTRDYFLGGVNGPSGFIGNLVHQLDDVRLYAEGLTADYAEADFNNTDSPGTFAVAGTPEDTGGATTVQLGQAVDTSSAFAVSPKRTLTLGQAIDTQSAFSATARRDLVVGQAVSAETARAVTARRAVSLQQAIETDTAFAATPLRTFTVGLASESDQAFAVQALRALALGRADETDSAFGATVVTGADIAVGQAVETDTAPSATVQRTVSVGQAVETDTAPSVTPVRTLTVGQAIETVTAFAVTPERGLTVGIATETDTAFGTGVLTTVALGQAVETDAAFSVTALGAGQIQVGLAVETDTAFGLTIIVTAQFVGPYRPRRPDLVSSYQPRRPDSGSDYRARRPDEEVQ